MSKKRPILLIILDGLGYTTDTHYNAFSIANTPHFDAWQETYAYTTLHASGSFVGLANTQNGNSEVGHFTLGSGTIIHQTATLLQTTMNFQNLCLHQTLVKELKNFNPDKTIHLIGLVSDGSVHSDIKHVYEILQVLAHYKFQNIAVHAILDGRDTPPQSALIYLKKLEKKLYTFQNATIATVHGRFYTMDRDNNYDRTKQAYNVMTQHQKTIYNYSSYIQDQYAKNITDEFIPPAACSPQHTIQHGDGALLFNYRPDRAKQITKMLLEQNLAFFITPVLYDQSLPTTPLIQAPQAKNTLLEILNANKKTMFTIAETEKFNHVTYFFNGHRSITFPYETRTLIPSLKVKSYDQAPAMKAQEITQEVLNTLNNPYDFYLINYANADMVGHCGNLQATVQAIETLDQNVGQLYEKIVVQRQGTIYITADHGNAEKMFDPTTKQPYTSHTNNPVPLYILGQKKQDLTHLQGLADIAPHILEHMKIPLTDSTS